MPIYEYACKKCGQTIEVIQKFSDTALKKHAGCGGALTKLISQSGFHFKGTGWYVTDYAKKSQPQGSEGGKEAKEGAEVKNASDAKNGKETKESREGKADSKESKSGSRGAEASKDSASKAAGTKSGSGNSSKSSDS